MARMFNPPHPGLTLRDDVLPALGLSVTAAAQQLDVSRVALSRVLHGRAAISPEMALRIEAWLAWRVEARPACGWQSKAPMTSGRPRSGSRQRRCTLNLHRWLPNRFAPTSPRSKFRRNAALLTRLDPGPISIQLASTCLSS